MSHTRLVALTVATAMLAGSGCGSSQPSKPLTSARLVAEADSICARVNAKRGTVTLYSPQSVVSLLPPLAAYEQAALAEMSRLTPPPSIADDWQQILANARAVADFTRRFSDDMISKDRQGARELLSKAGSLNPSSTLVAAARRDGFKACLQNA